MSTRYLKPQLLPFVVASIVLLLSAVAWYLTDQSIAKYQQSRFLRLSAQVEHEIIFRMQTYINALVQTKSMFQVTRRVDRQEFQAYIDSLGLIENYPGIQGIGVTERISAGELRAHERRVRAEGFAHYRVWPELPRAEYHSIVYLEPFNWRNRRAFGYDMFTDPVRRAAMEQARDSGKPASSGKVTLVQETDQEKQPGFLIYVPIYRNGAPADTIEQRRRALMGFVYSPFRANDLFSGIFSEKDLAVPVGFRVRLGSGPDSETLIHERGLDMKSTSSQLQRTFALELAGQPWRIEVWPLKEFHQSASQLFPWVIVWFGLLVSTLLFWILRRHERHLTAEAERMLQLEALNRAGKALAAELDLERLVQAVTDAGRELSRAQVGAFFYSVRSASGDAYTLYTVSGAPKEAFNEFSASMMRTPVFESTFNGAAIVRSADITCDPRYGDNGARLGLRAGNIPVRSYLAVPVLSRTGEVIGGLFFGHERIGVFGDREQKLVEGLAAQAAIAVDNARLFQRTKEAISSRDEFLSIASHELKTPITSLKLQLQLFRRAVKPERGETPPLEKLMRVLDVSLKQVNRLVSLIDDLLDVSRIQSGKLSYSFQELDFSAVVEEMVDRFGEQLQSADCGVTMRLDKSVRVSGDPFRLEQVILNLLTNAAKYGAGRPIEITVRRAGLLKLPFDGPAILLGLRFVITEWAYPLKSSRRSSTLTNERSPLPISVALGLASTSLVRS